MGLLLKEKSMLIHLDNCDNNDYMKMSGMFNYYQDIAAIHAFEIGAGYSDMVNKGYYWVLLYERIDVDRVPKMYENVTVRTWPKKREKLEFEREFEMLDENNKVISRGISTWVVIDTKRRMISKAKDVEFIGQYYDKTYYNDKPKKRLNLNEQPFIDEVEYKVTINDLDHNGHMNNAKYLDVINLLRRGKLYKMVEASFIKEIMLDDIIHLGYYIDNENNDCYIGYVNDSIAFEVLVKGE